MDPDLVAREDEIETVRSSVTSSPGGIVVYGEAGVGKTSLVRSSLAGMTRLEGGCLATLAWAPYLGLRRALGDHLPEETWTGDPAYVAEEVEGVLDHRILHIDDLQWADPATSQVLDLLTGRCRLVATIRRGDPGARDSLDRVMAAGLPRLDLHPLAPADAEDLVHRIRPELPPLEARALVERSGGNPLLLEELADAEADVASLHRAVLARCRQLPDLLIDDLALLALAGQPLAASHLREPAGLVESGIVIDDRGFLSIRHALIGEVIDDLLSEERQHRTHLRLADLLTHPGERARHLLAAGETEPAHAAAMQAVAEAATAGERVAHLETAARCVDPVDGAEFRLLAAEAAMEVDLLDVAVQLVDGLPDLPGQRHRIARLRSAHAYHLGDAAALPDLADRSLAVASPGTTEEVLSLVDQSFAILATTGDRGELARAVALAERAVALSEQSAGGRTAALKALADARWLAEDDRWRPAMQTALADARAEGDIALEWRIANNWISALQTHGPLDEGLALAEEMSEKFDRLRLTGIRRNFDYRRLNLLENLADYPALLDGLPPLLDAPGMAATMEVDVICMLAEAEIQTGRFEAGTARLRHPAVTSTERGRSSAHRILTEAHLDLDRPDLAAAELASFDTYDTGLIYQVQLAPTRAWIAHALDLPAPERPELLVAEGMFAGVGAELDGVDAMRRGDFGAAARHQDDAAELYRGRYDARTLRCLWAAGEARRLAGAADAAEALERAEAAAQSRGVVPMVRRAERSLRLLGLRRSAAVARSATSPLTGREQQVSLMAADGLTDNEIGDRLGLTRRTVQTLLANARRKLGAENRAHLVRLVTEDAP